MINENRDTANDSSACRVLAMLLGRPDVELIDALNSGAVYEALEFMQGDVDLTAFREGNYNLSQMLEQYYRCFEDSRATPLCLAESVYKSWSEDPQCPAPMAGARGYLMGEPALHMLELYRHFGLEYGSEFNGRPDHLALELDFLAFLYENHTEEMVIQFIGDHLNWIDELLERGREIGLCPFYYSVIRSVKVFLDHKTLRMELR
ncbi:MAG: molecular chaperone TorD family protein [Nitrospirae bacterium]|uniref:TorD/DmsD family molecular chaperone n=1 Tax=Candidatus Magnetobacterium casense TaxID=1455061 RepID=UPI00058AF91C|nr:molecular chaperone TorD family protein [Candidatus Magnetobacterium casensis]MBF0338283.1 molecular chaperone TorD family protein [Nitrospirota bacterium]